MKTKLIIAAVIALAVASCERKPILEWPKPNPDDVFAAGSPPDWVKVASEKEGLRRAMECIDSIIFRGEFPTLEGHYDAMKEAMETLGNARYAMRKNESLAVVEHAEMTARQLFIPLLQTWVCSQRVAEESQRIGDPDGLVNYDKAEATLAAAEKEFKALFQRVRPELIDDRERLARL